MIRSNESMPCTVINTKQINSCETDGRGSTIKGQELTNFCLRTVISVLNSKYFVETKTAKMTWPSEFFFSDFSSLIVLTWWGCGTPGAADTYWQAKQSDFGSCGSSNSHVQVVEAMAHDSDDSNCTCWEKQCFPSMCNTAGCWKVEDLLNQMWKIFDKLYVKILNITTPS